MSRHRHHRHRHEDFLRGSARRSRGVWVAPMAIGMPQQCDYCGGISGHDTGCPVTSGDTGMGDSGAGVGDAGGTSSAGAGT